MAEGLPWRGAGASGQRDGDTRNLVEQILRGNGLSAFGQRSVSSGRHPRLASDTTVSRELDNPAVQQDRGEAGGLAAGRSPRPRSVSVGRRQQDMQELANVVQELHSKGRVIQTMSSSLLQELPPSSTLPRSMANVGSSARDGSSAAGPSLGTSTGGGAATINSSRGPVAVPDARGYGVSLGATSRGRSAGGGVSGGGASVSAVASKGVTRSILGGVESLTSKLEMLGDRLTPKKAAPHDDHHAARRDASAGRRHNTSGAPGGREGAPNLRELLAAVNAGLLQGNGLQDTAQGNRDQRPMLTAANAAYTGQASSAAAGSQAGVHGAGTSAVAGGRERGGDSGTSAGAGSNMYSVGSASAELAASMILQNRRRTSEDIMAADRLLQNLQADIRAVAPSSHSGSGTVAAAPTAPAAAQAAPAPVAATQAARPISPRRSGREAGPAAAPAIAAPAEGEALGSAALAHHRYGGGMLQSFFASLSEAVTPPRSPVAHRSSSAAAGPAATPAAPVVPAHVSTAGHGPFAYAYTDRSSRHSTQDGSHPGPSNATGLERGRSGFPHQPQPERRPGRHDLLPADLAVDAAARTHGGLHSAAAAAAFFERASAGGASGASSAATGAVALHAELGPRLSELQRVAETVCLAALDAEGSAGSVGASGGAGGGVNGVWSSSQSQPERREQQPAAVGAGGQARAHGTRVGSSIQAPLGAPPGLPRTRSAWPDGGPGAAAARAGGSSAADAAAGDGRLGSASSRGEAAGAHWVGYHREAAPFLLPGGGHAPGPRIDQAPLSEADGLHMALLKQQRRKDRERREEQGRHEAAEAAAAAARARQQAVDWQEQHDRLMTQYLATRQRLEALEAVHERIVRDGCSGCEKWRQQLQHASDDAANTAAQLRDLRAQLQEARSREDATRRQLAQTAATAHDKAAAEEQLRTTLEHALKELLDLSAEASSSLAAPGAKPHAGRDSGSAGPGGAAEGVASMLDSLRLRLREQSELARRQRELLDTIQDQIRAERASAAAERAESAARTIRELDFQRNRAEGLQEELDRQRESNAKLELRVRQIEDERDRAVRQRDAAALSIEAQQRQLETAMQQQDTLVGRMFEAQRAREDAEVLISQVRSLSQQLEVARAAASRAESLERKVAEERDAKDELAARLSEVEAQLKEREGALESVRRHVREQEATTNSAVASRLVVMEQASKRSDEIRALTQENAKMFHHLENLQQEKKKAESQVAVLSSQLLAAQDEATTLRVELAAVREQLAGMQSMQPLQDATLAQHQLSGELLKAQAEVAALRTLSEALGEYADGLKRTLRRHGLQVPDMPGAAEVVTQIGTLQSKLAAEADAAAAARADASHLRLQLDEAKAETERLRRELQSLEDRCAKLEAAESSSRTGWEQAEAKMEAAMAQLTNERDGLQRELNSLRAAGSEEVLEARRQLARLEVQVDALGTAKRQAEEDVATLSKDLGLLRAALVEKDAEVERLRLACEDAKAAAERADAARRAKEEQAAAAVAAREAAEAEAKEAAQKLEELQSEVARLEADLAARNAEYAGLYDYCAEEIGRKEALLEERERFTAAAQQAEADLGALRGEVEQLRADLADREQRLLVKPKMAELQYRVNELSAQLTEVIEERDAARTECSETARKLQEETESHYETDGRRVRLGEEVERLRGILRMYSIPF